MKNPNMARPGNSNALHGDDPRGASINLRCSASEKTAYAAAAEASGVRLSVWIRQQLDAAASIK